MRLTRSKLCSMILRSFRSVILIRSWKVLTLKQVFYSFWEIYLLVFSFCDVFFDFLQFHLRMFWFISFQKRQNWIHLNNFLSSLFNLWIERYDESLKRVLVVQPDLGWLEYTLLDPPLPHVSNRTESWRVFTWKQLFFPLLLFVESHWLLAPSTV